MMVRCGAAVYGCRTGGPKTPPELRPIMSVTTTIARIADYAPGVTLGYGSTFVTTRTPHTRVCTLPMGFADGYPRSLANKGAVVLVAGCRCPILGKISMNVMSVDVSEVPDAKVGDVATLFGSQGGVTVGFEEMADRFHSVHTEFNVGLGAMNPVRYVSS